ncbi:5-formyltetrahydrofolate cyclo-ligase [Paenibacillus sp. P96]|uniref:5-formyltetrahydrofolate cyclo-ligase n=1 Tax=Paenibacillus zeirhizosphaerae TaxID=2987519 RepID=A0ABT9FW80_9BACL|nr:5-formyltetrahydrofolate cyclo-ligase [Paenibacillus sp. P96]MDP4098919.1 5-formyltetrahydrofolate cyclo-ligase [Paenibacillus sp. P96]
MDVRTIKARLRAEMRSLRNEMSAAERLRASAAACGHAIKLWEELRAVSGWKQLTLFTYLSFGSELDTTPLVRHCWSRGDRVLAPKVDKVSRTFELRSIKSVDELSSGSWGIPEPVEACPLWPVRQWSQLDWVVVPGLAFDLAGGRIGYGGGFYDRFTRTLLQECSRMGEAGPSFVSLALPGQIISHIPMEPGDLRVDRLITAEGAISAGKG